MWGLCELVCPVCHAFRMSQSETCTGLPWSFLICQRQYMWILYDFCVTPHKSTIPAYTPKTALCFCHKETFSWPVFQQNIQRMCRSAPCVNNSWWMTLYTVWLWSTRVCCRLLWETGSETVVAAYMVGIYCNKQLIGKGSFPHAFPCKLSHQSLKGGCQLLCPELSVK